MPGVGSYSKLCKMLKTQLISSYLKKIIRKQTMFLGICVGMQVLSDYGYENDKLKVYH